jgi:hypothetical protein
LEFLDYDISFDIAASEFGYPETTAMGLLKRWRVNPIGIAIRNIITRQLGHFANTLALDFAEHVSPYYDSIFRFMDSRPMIPMIRLINIGRDFLKCGQGYEINRVVSAQKDAYKASVFAENEHLVQELTSHSSKDGYAMEAGLAAKATSSALASIVSYHKDTWSGDYKYDLEHTAKMASFSVAHSIYRIAHHDTSAGPEEIAELRESEMQWQLRRFVDCMEAVSQSKNWPDLGVTK